MRPTSVHKLERKATEILHQAHAHKVPVPLEVVAHRLGLTVESTPLGDDVSGVLVVEDGRGRIGYNAAHARVRQRFTIAHEIAHFVLHAQSSKVFIDKSYTVYRRDQRSATGDDLVEVQANQFAAALLMPEDLVLAEIQNVGFDLGDERGLDILADTFQVSRQAMSHRLANLDILGSMR